jgi:hypothetical protein
VGRGGDREKEPSSIHFARVAVKSRSGKWGQENEEEQKQKAGRRSRVVRKQ